jgi:hypothetical protein
MADITKLRSLVETYGIAVRAGAVTPCLEDEKYFREMMDLPEISSGIISDWEKTQNIRRPITLAKDEEPKPQVEELENQKP